MEEDIPFAEILAKQRAEKLQQKPAQHATGVAPEQPEARCQDVKQEQQQEQAGSWQNEQQQGEEQHKPQQQADQQQQPEAQPWEQQQPHQQQEQPMPIASTRATRKRARKQALSQPQVISQSPNSKRRKREPKRLGGEGTPMSTEETSDLEEGDVKDEEGAEEEVGAVNKREAEATAAGGGAKRARVGHASQAPGTSNEASTTPEPQQGCAGATQQGGGALEGAGAGAAEATQGRAGGEGGGRGSASKHTRPARQARVGARESPLPQATATAAAAAAVAAGRGDAPRRQALHRQGRGSAAGLEEDKLKLLQQTMQNFDAARVQVEKLGSDLQGLVDALYQEPFGQIVTVKKELVRSIKSLGQRKEDETFKRLKTSAMELWQIWKEMNSEAHRPGTSNARTNDTAAANRHLAKPPAETLGTDSSRVMQRAGAAKTAGLKQEPSTCGNQGTGQPAAQPSHLHHPFAAASAAVMPNGSATPPNAVLLSGFSSTGDSTRDAAVSLLAACLEEPATTRAPVEVALEAEELLYERFAEPTSDASAVGNAPQKLPGNAYKIHLHALWRLLLDAAPTCTSDKEAGAAVGPGSSHQPGATASIGESSRRALLENVFTTKQLMDSVFC